MSAKRSSSSSRFSVLGFAADLKEVGGTSSAAFSKSNSLSISSKSSLKILLVCLMCTGDCYKKKV